MLRSGNGAAAQMLRAMRSFLGENDMMAYLAMMAVRLLELHRVLKPTGSLYLHCDLTASHYLKILLDAVFGARNFRNEIVWHRRPGMSSAVHDLNRFGATTDSVFFFAKSNGTDFHVQYNKDAPDYQEYIRTRFTLKDKDGRLYQATSLVNPAFRPNLQYDYKGYKSPPNGWMISREKMEQWDEEGRLHFPSDSSKRIRRKSYADELKGMPVQSLWTDIPPINARAQERLGYPTQKPVALLERIVAASSNPGDVVLDPFCGCGTTVHAAEKLGRRWIGIDVTHLAIGLIEKRLRDAFPKVEFQTHGVPQDLSGARDLARRGREDKNYYFEFEKWALSLIAAQPGNLGKKGADRGIDGNIYFAKTARAIVSVKAGDNVGVGMIRDLRGVIEREKAEIGVFLTWTERKKTMISEAAAAGQFEIEGFAPVPRIQVVTIAEALELRDRAVRLPLRRDDAFRKAAREEVVGAQGKFDL